MYKLLFLFTLFTLTACSSTGSSVKYKNVSPRGISILNLIKEDRVKAYRTAEKHCAKYYKVPRVLRTIEQEGESEIPLSTMVFECVRPSN